MFWLHADSFSIVSTSSAASLLQRNSTQFTKTFYNFSSVQFYLAKVNYNAKIHIRIVTWQGSPEETRRPMKPALPSHKEISKMINQSQLERERKENLALTVRCPADALWHNLCLKVLSFRKLQNIKIRWISFSVDGLKIDIYK